MTARHQRREGPHVASSDRIHPPVWSASTLVFQHSRPKPGLLGDTTLVALAFLNQKRQKFDESPVRNSSPLRLSPDLITVLCVSTKGLTMSEASS